MLNGYFIYNAVGGPGDCKMILKSNDTLELLYIHVYTYEKLNKPRTQLHNAMDLLRNTSLKDYVSTKMTNDTF